MAAVTLASSFRIGGPRPFVTDPVDSSAGGTMRLDTAATFDAADSTSPQVVDIGIETSANSTGPWRLLGAVRLERGATSKRVTITGVDAYSRLSGAFTCKGGVSLTVSGDLL